MSDILVDIPDEDLPKLADMYEKHQDWAPHVFTCVHTGMRFKKSKKYHDKMTFLSPNNCWEKDGTIIVLMTFNCYDVFVFTLDNKCENLWKGLSETKRIDYSAVNFLFFVHEKHYPTIARLQKTKNLPEKLDIWTTIYAISPDEAKKFTVEIPPELYYKPLDTSHADQINSVWPLKYKGSEKYVECLIEINGGVGLFLKSNDQLVAWILVHCLGHLGLLQTEENYKRKGYGSIVTKILSKQIGENGFWPTGTVILENRASEKMFEKMNFRDVGRSNFLQNAKKF